MEPPYFIYRASFSLGRTTDKNCYLLTISYAPKLPWASGSDAAGHGQAQ